MRAINKIYAQPFASRQAVILLVRNAFCRVPTAAC